VYYKKNLVIMSNFYYKVALTSVCVALGFVLGADEKAYSATFTLPSTVTFSVIDYLPSGADGRGDSFHGTLEDGFSAGAPSALRGRSVETGKSAELATFSEINLGNLSFAPNTSINSAIFQAGFAFGVTGIGITDPISNPGSLGIFGYIGNGTAEISDFEAAILLSSIDISSFSTPGILNFDVTSFVNQRVNNGDAFAGFSIRALNFGAVTLTPSFTGVPLKLIVETAEPVPEPTTIFGSVLALSLGGWLKRKKLSQQNKTTPQA
jgi:hypothetical protein